MERRALRRKVLLCALLAERPGEVAASAASMAEHPLQWTDRVPALAALKRGIGGVFRSPERRGMVGVLVVAIALGLLHVFMLPKFRPADEPRHAAYAILLMDGQWPKVTDPLPLKRLGVKKIMDQGVYVAAANHPPLYYWIVGLPLKIAADRNNLWPGLLVARTLSLLMGLSALVYVFKIGKLLLPRRPAIALTVAMLTAIIPTFLNTCGIVYNDSLGVLTSVAALYGGMAILTLGPTRGRLIATGVWMALAVFTRISGLFSVGPALLMTFIGVIKHTDGTALRRVLRSAGVCLAMLAGIAATSGWFYYRNYKLYGDVTASAVLFKLFSRKPNGTTIELLLSGKRWLSMFDLLWMRLAGHVNLKTALTRVVELASAAGALLAIKAIWHRRSSLRLGSLKREPHIWAMAASLLAFFCVVVPMFVFHAKGGNLNMRYLLPVTWVPMMIIAVGLASVRSPLLAQVGTTLFVLVSLVVHELYGQSLIKRGKTVDLGIAAALTEAGSKPAAPWIVFLFVAFSLGLVLFLRSLGELHRRIDEPMDADGETPPPEPAAAAASTDPEGPHAQAA